MYANFEVLVICVIYEKSDHIHYLKTTRKDLLVFVWTGNPRVTTNLPYYNMACAIH